MINNIKVFKAMGDETRIKILILLSQRNICAKGIARHLDISEAAVSQHIKVLKEIDLVIGYKRGYHVVYDLNKDVLKGAIAFIDMIINDDVCSLSKKFNLDEEFEELQCSSSCKKMKSCCKKRFEEE